MKPTKIFSLLTFIILAGCGKQEQTPDSTALPKETAEQSQNTGEGSHESPWDESEAPVPGTSIFISPSHVDFCADKIASVEVSWDLTAAAPKNPQIWVRDSKGEKLWTAFKQLEGNKMTGKWVKKGIQFVAVDSTTKKAINSVTVEAADCK